MVTLQGEKKGWNGTKPWCLNDLVSSFNPCAPCSLESLWSFRCFSPKVASNNMVCYIPTEMLNGFYNLCFDQTRLASMSARHGELIFLHQWVSATSAFEDLGRLASELLAMASCVRPGLAMAHGRRVETWIFCLSSPWSRLWARRGELTFAFLHVFLLLKCPGVHFPTKSWH